MNPTRLSVTVAWFLFLCGNSALGQEGITLQQVEAKTRAALGKSIPNVPPLEVSRLGGLRQDAYAIQESLAAIAPSQVRSIDFFELFPATFVVSNGRPQTTTISLDSEPTWLVATDQESNEWFFLHGFPEATSISDFNRLVQHLGLAVKNDQAALELFDFYLKIATGPAYRGAIPSDELSLQAIVSQDYVGRYASDQRAAKFRRWWDKEKTTRKNLGPPRVQKTGERYEVKFFRYTQDELATEHIYLSAAGLVSLDEH